MYVYCYVFMAITLKCTTVEGRDIRDEYLGEFPTLVIGAPTITENPEITQAQVNQQWMHPTAQMRMGASFASDLYEIADAIREWASDATKPFPLNVSESLPPSPTYKTRFEIVACPHVDRLWYVERPFIFRLRPLHKVEFWEAEAAYWESQGDHDRAELLRERIDEHTGRANHPAC